MARVLRLPAGCLVLTDCHGERPILGSGQRCGNEWLAGGLAPEQGVYRISLFVLKVVFVRQSPIVLPIVGDVVLLCTLRVHHLQL